MNRRLNHRKNNQMNNQINRWLSVDEVAEHLGVKRDTVYKWIERKNLPAHKAGRLWKFKVDEVDDWVRGGGRDQGLHTI